MKKINANTITSLGLIIVMLAVLIWPFVQVAQAAPILNTSDTMSSVKDNTVSNHTIVFRTQTGAADSTDTITIEFDTTGTAFTVPGALDFTDVDLSHSAGGQSNCTAPTYTNEETLAATASATAWGVGVNVTTDIITLTAPTDGIGVAAIAANACVRIKIGTNATAGDQQITNPDITTATSYVIRIAGTFESPDTGDMTVNIILDDQVAVTASVTQSITFTVDDNSIGFGTLVTANARFANGAGTGTDGPTSASAHTLTIATNAATGYNITYNGATLTSGANTITVAPITGDEDGAPGSEQFAIGFTTNGNATIVSAYNQVTPIFNYSFVASTATQIVSETVPTATETISAFYLANIAGTTEAGSYSTTLTYVATANF